MNIPFNVYEAEQCSNSCGETVAGGMPWELPGPERCLRAICLRPPFLSVVDSRPGFRYSVDLARCCARGLYAGVHTDRSSSAGRSPGPGWPMPRRGRLEQATGGWILNVSSRARAFRGQAPAVLTRTDLFGRG